MDLNFLTDDAVQIEYDARWMGSGIHRYELNFRHVSLSGVSGVLYLENIQRYVSATSTELITEPPLSRLIQWGEDDDESWGSFLKPYDNVWYEYILLPVTAPWIADAPDLDEMKDFFNLAKWNKTFDCFLWTNYPGIFDPDLTWLDTKIKEVLLQLDKLKFAGM